MTRRFDAVHEFRNIERTWKSCGVLLRVKMDLQRQILANFNIPEIGPNFPRVHTEPDRPAQSYISRKQIYHLTVGEVVTSLPFEFALAF